MFLYLTHFDLEIILTDLSYINICKALSSSSLESEVKLVRPSSNSSPKLSSTKVRPELELIYIITKAEE